MISYGFCCWNAFQFLCVVTKYWTCVRNVLTTNFTGCFSADVVVTCSHMKILMSEEYFLLLLFRYYVEVVHEK